MVNIHKLSKHISSKTRPHWDLPMDLRMDLPRCLMLPPSPPGLWGTHPRRSNLPRLAPKNTSPMLKKSLAMHIEKSSKSTAKHSKRMSHYSKKSEMPRSRSLPRNIVRLWGVSAVSWPIQQTTKKVVCHPYKMLSFITKLRKLMLVSIYNAITVLSDLHFPGCSAGNHLSLAKIQELVAEDPELQGLSKDRQQELKNSVLEARQLKSQGAWASNLGAAMDAKATMARVDSEASLSNQFLPCSLWCPSSSSTLRNMLVPMYLHFSQGGMSMIIFLDGLHLMKQSSSSERYSTWTPWMSHQSLNNGLAQEKEVRPTCPLDLVPILIAGPWQPVLLSILWSQCALSVLASYLRASESILN